MDNNGFSFLIPGPPGQQGPQGIPGPNNINNLNLNQVASIGTVSSTQASIYALSGTQRLQLKRGLDQSVSPIAETSDLLSYLPLSGGVMTGGVDFGTANATNIGTLGFANTAQLNMAEQASLGTITSGIDALYAETSTHRIKRKRGNDQSTDTMVEQSDLSAYFPIPTSSQTIIGLGATGTGLNATAYGESASAAGTSDTAIGPGATTTTGKAGQTALGHLATCTDSQATALGQNTSAASASVAIGQSAQATSTNTIAIGESAVASASGAITLGQGVTNATGDSCLIGDSLIVNIRPANTATCTLGTSGATFADLYSGLAHGTGLPLTTGVTGLLPLSNAGTNASLTAALGAIPYSSASAIALLAPTATARQLLQSGASAAPSWSTATYPATTVANNLLYSSATNTVANLASAASGVLVTDGSSVPSISSTLPTGLAMQTPASINLTNASALPTSALTGQVALANGGTNANLTAANGAIPYSTASALALLAPTVTARQMLQSGASGAPAWSTATYPATTTANNLLYSSATNTVANLASGASGVLVTDGSSVPSISSTLPSGLAMQTPASINLTNASSLPTSALTGQVSLASGGTNANLTASNGGIPYSTATALAILAGTATAGQIIRSGASAAPTWSTTTYPATNAINTLLYASSANVMGSLSTSNSSVLVTDGSGVPSLSTALPASLTATSMTLTTPNIGVATATTLVFSSTTTGGIIGVTDGSVAGAGKVGEVISSSVLNGSAVSLTTTNAANVTSISVTAGAWEISGSIYLNVSGGTLITSFNGGISTASATLGVPPLGSAAQFMLNLPFSASGVAGQSTGSTIQNISGTTIFYLVVNCTFTVNSCAAFGHIKARRIR